MSKLSEFLKSLFQQQKSNKPQVPFLHEAINVGEYPVSEMLQWEAAGGWNHVKTLVNTAYNNRLITGKSISQGTALLTSSHNNGWLFQCRSQPNITDTEYKHLAHLIYLKIKEIGYTLNLSEIRSRERSPKIETIVKYYLKPSLKNRIDPDGDTTKARQLYGNITIEYTAVDGIPFEFKFIASAYQDHKFFPPDDFDRLIEDVFG